jgi:arylsulfatase A-like enzyme
MGAVGMQQSEGGDTLVGRWPRVVGRNAHYVHTSADQILRVDLKIAGWVEVWVDRQQVLGQYLRAGSHRIPGLFAEGTHALELRSPRPLRAFLGTARAPRAGSEEATSAQATPPQPHTLSGPLRIPAGTHLELGGAGRAQATLRCGNHSRSVDVVAGETEALPVEACAGAPVDFTLEWVAPSVVTAATLLVPAPTLPPRPDNVVMVLIDTLRMDRLRAFYPDARPITPAMDHIAAESWVFRETIAASNWTKPSVATLLTGWSPERHGAITHEARLPDEAPFIPEEAQEGGFQTLAFVSNGYVSESYGFGRGWSHYHSSGNVGRSRAHELVEDAFAYLDGPARDPEAPFFLYLHTTDPHYPYDPPARILADYHEGEPTLDVGNRRLLQHIDEGSTVLTSAQRQELIDRYDAEVAYHDEAMAALYAGLESRGLLGNTALVFVADHGEELFDHGQLGHGGPRLWDELVRVPLLIRWPDGSARVVDDAVGHADVSATLRWAMGLEARTDTEGVSLAQAAYGPLRFRRASRPGTLAAITDGRDRMILPLRPGRSALLQPESNAAFTRLLGYLSSVDMSRTPPTPVLQGANDADTLAQLRALGYIE